MESDTYAPNVGSNPDPTPGPDLHRNEGDEESQDEPGHSRRRLAVCSALAGLVTGGWLLWSAPMTPTLPLPSPAALKPGGVNTVFLLSLIENIRDAKPVVNEERDRTAAERDAFAQFSEQVARMDATRTPAAGGPTGDGGVLAMEVGAEDARLTEVARAYRNTVLSVPHYDEEYGESLGEHMAGEFGDEIATTVLHGQAFTPWLKDALVDAGSEARLQRETLVRTLDSESDALARAEDLITEVESELDSLVTGSLHQRSFEDLSAAWLRIRGLERRCEELLWDRQRRIHHGHAIGLRTLDGKRLHEYLYNSLEAHHPVLADGAELVDRVKSARHRITRAISRRV